MGLMEELKRLSKKRKDKESLYKELKKPPVFVPDVNDVRRVCELPLFTSLTQRAKEVLDREIIFPSILEAGWNLFPCQADALDAYTKFSGVFGIIGVGWGKTLIALKIAHEAYKKGIHRILLLLPASGYYQLVQRDIPFYRTKTTIAVPFNYMGRIPRKQRKLLAKSRRPGCYIFPYSCLSTEDSIENLEYMKPGLIICDEAHYVKNRNARRTARLFNFVKKNKPEMVALSGTMTSKGLQDYWHIIVACLGELAPVPNTRMIAADWAEVINASTVFLNENQTKFMLPLLKWARDRYPEEEFYENVSGIRKAYQKRMVTAPGVVSTPDSEIGTSLVIENLKIENYKEIEGWETLKELIDKVQNDYVTPNGDEIDHAIHTYKWLYEFSSGFYNNLVWPTVGEYANRKSIHTEEARKLLERAKEHHEASQDYVKGFREYLHYHPKTRFDTPFLMGTEILRNGSKNVGIKLSKLWNRMKNLKFDGMPKRNSTQVKVSPFKRDAAVEWACQLRKKYRKQTGGLIWVHHIEFGKWILEGLLERGLEAIYCGAGPVASAQILAPENANKIIVASIGAQKEVSNLQHFQHAYYAQWPRSAKEAEQSLGRIHRNGQKADEIVIHTNNTLYFDDIVLAACLNDALYVHQTTPNRQKLIYATWNPLPKIYSPEFLRERGMENRTLNAGLKKDFQDRFGSFKDEKGTAKATA